MKPRTTCLFHFTKSIDILCKILNEGLWPQYSLENIEWLKGPQNRLAWPMVSFCDISITRLRDHTEFYGNYGIGFTRDDFIFYGVNPVIYVSSDVGSPFKTSLHEIQAIARDKPNQRFMTNVAIILSHCKPMKGPVLINGLERERDFYSECEWRYVPLLCSDRMKYGFTLTEGEFENHRLEANTELRQNMLEIVPSDVKYLLVKSEEDVPKLIEFINLELLRYAPDVLDRLKTRIVVLDEIERDY